MKSSYYKLPADEIYERLAGLHDPYNVNIEGVDLSIHPHVYPSEKFRTTRFVLRSLQKKFMGKTVCDMGCGPGVVGLYALKNGAKKVVQSDINPFAVKNAIENRKINAWQAKEALIYQSDCFDSIPTQVFDIIVWNMPFHNDEIEIADPLKRAFYDPGFNSIRKFLNQSPGYSRSSTEIFVAFSSKGDTVALEKIFSDLGYNWEIWKITNENQDYDNRIYSLSTYIN